jgi:hypothetical protein
MKSTDLLNKMMSYRHSKMMIFLGGICTASFAFAGISGPVVSHDTGSVFYQITSSGTPVNFRMFMDTDLKATTGYTRNGTGANYMLNNGTLYRYTGSGSDWTWAYVKDVGYNKTTTVANWTVARADLGSPVAIDLVGQTNTPEQNTPKLRQTLTEPTPTTTSTSATRDPLQWPFASSSIWNMPIGSGAVYVAANMPAVPGNSIWAPMPQLDEEHIILKPTAPLTAVSYNSAGWSGANRCPASSRTLVNLPIPSNYIVPNSRENNSAAILAADGRTVVQVQPLARCATGGPATSIVVFPSVDLYSTGITGAHGGSGLSALGGSLRRGELRPGGQGPRHALKLNVDAKGVLYKCTTRSACYRWPATTADGYAVGNYGTTGNISNTAMKMGALLAIPTSRNIASMGLETEPGRMLAWTLQNYGAYIVDDTGGASVAINTETGPDGSLRTQFKADWGYEMAQRVNDKTPWMRDMQRLVTALSVVNNNSPTSIGGGGVPLQPLAPPLP